MAFEFKFPDVGEGIHEGKIVRWLVKEGDTVKADDSIAEVETDKAVVEIPSPKAGKILKITHKEGDVIKVGEVLVTLDDGGASAPAPQSTATTPAVQQAPAQVKTPDEQGALIKKADAAEGPRESTGVVGSLEPTAAGVMKAPTLNASGAVFGGRVAPLQQQPTVKSVPITELAKQEKTTEVKSEAQAQPTASGGVNVIKAGIKAVKKYDMFGYIDRAPYDGVRKVVGDHMVKSVFTIPHVTHTDMADVTELWKIREKEKVKAEKNGIKLTFMPFFIKAIIAGLMKHPYLNAMLDEQAGQIILKKYYNIGIAVDTEAGLMVPVIKGADKKSILDIAKDVQDFAEKARTRKINPMDFKGGTFTITNIGSAGSGWFATPVINFPEAAILGTGMIQDMVVARGGTSKTAKAVIRKMLPLSLSFDHRILDGAEAARFVVTVKEHLEDPALMLVEGK